ncbi:MAG: ABC transporter substrate-binding protein [Acidobacteria bacterium]|nr:MAG: ABC transporter substrate-binding protein [Acidobacteriota bacterium]
MRRRAFIAGLSALATWPLGAARGQQRDLPVIGYLSNGSAASSVPYLAAFLQGLKDTGYIDGQNATIEYRWANGQFDRLPQLLDELISRRVNVLVAAAASVLARAAPAGIPVVSLFAGDPIKSGLVASLNRPGGNFTGVNMFAFTLGPKRLELLSELVSQTQIIAILNDPGFPSPDARADLAAVETVARAAGRQIHVVSARSANELENAFADMLQHHAGALLVMADPLFNNHREKIVALAGRYGIPAIYEWRQFAEIGGLMSYGSSLTDAQRQMGVYAGKILQGSKPADLPIVQTVKVELVLNLRTAKALNLAFPLALLGRADEVIE